MKWSSDKQQHKKVPAAERKADAACCSVLQRLMNRNTDCSDYMHLPALRARAMLLAARDFTDATVRSSKRGEERPLLVPELSACLRKYGRALQRGSDEEEHLHGAVPMDAVTWDGVVLTKEERGTRPCKEQYMTAAGQQIVSAHRARHAHRAEEWRIHREMEQRAAEERARRQALIQEFLDQGKAQKAREKEGKWMRQIAQEQASKRRKVEQEKDMARKGRVREIEE